MLFNYFVVKLRQLNVINLILNGLIIIELNVRFVNSILFKKAPPEDIHLQRRYKFNGDIYF